jgi:hypothetical protein
MDGTWRLPRPGGSAELKVDLVSVPESVARAVQEFAVAQNVVGHGYDETVPGFVFRVPRDADNTASIIRLAAAWPATIVVRDSQFTKVQLAELTELVSRRDWSPEAKSYTYGFAYDPLSDTLRISGNFTIESIQPLADRYGPLITLRSHPGQPMGRRPASWPRKRQI